MGCLLHSKGMSVAILVGLALAVLEQWWQHGNFIFFVLPGSKWVQVVCLQHGSTRILGVGPSILSALVEVVCLNTHVSFVGVVAHGGPLGTLALPWLEQWLWQPGGLKLLQGACIRGSYEHVEGRRGGTTALVSSCRSLFGWLAGSAPCQGCRVGANHDGAGWHCLLDGAERQGSRMAAQKH